MILAWYAMIIFAQPTPVKKLEYVIIIDNQIVSKEKLEEYGKLGWIKAMNKGVTQDEWQELSKKFGDRIGEKDFIIKVALLSEKERDAVKIQPSEPSAKNDTTKELKLNLDDAAADFTVEMLDGAKVSLSALKGKVVLINYWATWCAPCLMEFTEFPEKILKPFQDNNFILLPISIGEDKEKVRKKMAEMKKYGVNFNVGLDQNKAIWDRYATGAIPKSFLIDQQGVIRFISIGNTDGSVSKLASEIKNLMEK